MSLLTYIRDKLKHQEHKRTSDAASRQMESDAQEEVKARLRVLEIKLLNESRKK